MSSKGKSKSSPKTSGKAKSSTKQKQNASVGGPEASCSTVLDVGSAMTGAIKEDDIKRIASIQNRSLKNFSKTNELLGKFNDYSSAKYDVLQHMFAQHTRLLVELKNDLTNVYLRIRRLKVKLQKQYPDAFEETFNLRQALEDELEQEDPKKPTYNGSTAATVNNDPDRSKESTESLNADDVITCLEFVSKNSSSREFAGKDSAIPEQTGSQNVDKNKVDCERDTTVQETTVKENGLLKADLKADPNETDVQPEALDENVDGNNAIQEEQCSHLEIGIAKLKECHVVNYNQVISQTAETLVENTEENSAVKNEVCSHLETTSKLAEDRVINDNRVIVTERPNPEIEVVNETVSDEADKSSGTADADGLLGIVLDSAGPSGNTGEMLDSSEYQLGGIATYENRDSYIKDTSETSGDDMGSMNTINDTPETSGDNMSSMNTVNDTPETSGDNMSSMNTVNDTLETSGDDMGSMNTVNDTPETSGDDMASVNTVNNTPATSGDDMGSMNTVKDTSDTCGDDMGSMNAVNDTPETNMNTVKNTPETSGDEMSSMNTVNDTPEANGDDMGSMNTVNDTPESSWDDMGSMNTVKDTPCSGDDIDNWP